MAKIKEREKACAMRQEGNSIADIAQQLQVSKSTVSMWCREIVLSEAALQRIVKRSDTKSTLAILRYTEGLRIKRQSAVLDNEAKGAEKLGSLSNRDIYCLGLGLYWGEGYKRGSQEFGFTNSDPQMIRFYITWLEVVFGVDSKDLILRISINNVHKERIKKVTEFWVKQTKVSIHQFTKPSFLKSTSKKSYANFDVHYGTLRIKVRRGTTMRREILGALKSINT